MPKYRSRAVVLDPFTPQNLLDAGLDEIRRLQGRSVSLLEPPRLLPWFMNTARNCAVTPEEAEFVEASERGFRNGLKQGRAVLDPEVTDGLATIALRDAAMWPEGEFAVAEARRSLRNLSLLGVADPFIRAYAMAKLGPIAGPAAMTVFDKAKGHIEKKASKARIERLRLIVPTAKGDKWRKRRDGRKR